MSDIKRIAFIGNSLPRRCGIATFTTDLQQVIAERYPEIDTCIVAMTDHGQVYDYPPSVCLQIRDDVADDYIRAADFLNTGDFDAVSLQHEFGIFGGEAGSAIVPLLARLKMPVVTTLHTVLLQPSASQCQTLMQVIDASARIIVMAEKGRQLLQEVYRVPAGKIDVIAHGIPDLAFTEPAEAKEELGFAERFVILTFGLLSPNKGIEVMIDAMPAILQRQPRSVYVVLGATHPNLVRDQGEAYRESLVARARQLGVEDHVVFLDRFVDKATLLRFISMCDVYVTPYLKEAQMTSGTLAYSFGSGKAVVSTPYWHARELLADGRGVLVPFSDPAAIGEAVADLLTNDERRLALRQIAYSASRSMTWEQTAERYATSFRAARRTHRPRLKPVAAKSATGAPVPLPDMRTIGLQSMCDDTGIFQHAIYCVPDRLHGYCVDDNARALLLSCALNDRAEAPLPELLTTRFASFVQHAWNPDTGRFRNFMSFDRRWLEDKGSEDSHGRTLWALGVCARDDLSPSRRAWATSLFLRALASVQDFTSPRAWAFSLLALNAYCACTPQDFVALRLRALLADQLLAILTAVETPDWIWFEDVLGYDNARLPQALIATGLATGARRYVTAGLRTLRWLTRLQTASTGLFRPVGTSSFGAIRSRPYAFDQQPVEAAATIAACRAAWRVDPDDFWPREAQRAFNWFLGGNDLSQPLADPETGSCRDGLHPDRVNENRGAESVLSYLLALTDMRALTHAASERPLVTSRLEMERAQRPIPFTASLN